MCSFLSSLREAVLQAYYALYVTDRLGTFSTVSHWRWTNQVSRQREVLPCPVWKLPCLQVVWLVLTQSADDKASAQVTVLHIPTLLSKVHHEGDINKLLLNLDTRKQCVVTLTQRPLYPCEECPCVSWKGRCICAQTPWTYWAFGSSVRSCQ